MNLNLQYTYLCTITNVKHKYIIYIYNINETNIFETNTCLLEFDFKKCYLYKCSFI